MRQLGIRCKKSSTAQIPKPSAFFFSTDATTNVCPYGVMRDFYADMQSINVLLLLYAINIRIYLAHFLLAFRCKK